MKKVMTEMQKREIKELAKEHCDALIAYGTDMHVKGVYKGAIIGVIGMTIGYAISLTTMSLKYKSETK